MRRPSLCDRGRRLNTLGGSWTGADGNVAGVTIRNLRVEVTESGDQTAIQSEAPDLVLENVEVRGDVTGVPGEASHWELPPVIALGDFAAEETNTFALKLHAAGTAELYCGIGGVGVHPARLAEENRRLD